MKIFELDKQDNYTGRSIEVPKLQWEAMKNTFKKNLRWTDVPSVIIKIRSKEKKNERK